MRFFSLLLALCVSCPASGQTSRAREYLASIVPSPELQTLLDQTIGQLMAADPALRRADVRIALLDLSSDPPRLAQRNGNAPIYPASVVKLVYLMAAYAWQEQGKLRIDAELDGALTHMIYESSNPATQRVVARLTDTSPGPELDPAAYAVFRQRRSTIDDWLQTLGITDLHCVNPTYDGNGDLYGRDQQFLRDRAAGGPLAGSADDFPNRNAMTAVGTAKLLALLATDRALTPSDSETVRVRMRRDPIQQPHLAQRIAGGAARLPGLQVYSKSGTWGPIYSDAGIVRDATGRGFILVVFTQGTPPYRGSFIADLTHRIALRLLPDKRVP
jgi:beta-lactamase class A